MTKEEKLQKFAAECLDIAEQCNKTAQANNKLAQIMYAIALVEAVVIGIMSL